MSMYRAVSPLLAAGFGVALYCGQALGAGPQDSGAKAPEPKVVFLCKYGSVKSLVAAETFNKLAEQRGLSLRAIGRAANPGTFHTEVHQVVVNGLAQDGIRRAALGREQRCCKWGRLRAVVMWTFTRSCSRTFRSA